MEYLYKKYHSTELELYNQFFKIIEKSYILLVYIY